MGNDKFLVSALVDFPDDCSRIVFTKEMVQDLIDKLHWMGIRRVYWNYYQEGIWPWFFKYSPGPKPTLENIGEPMTLGCKMAHDKGMEFYAVIKPFETGPSLTSPPGSEWVLDDPGIPGIGGSYHVDEWTKRHPEFRVRSRTADMPPGTENATVTRVQLRQKDMRAVRIKADNVQIWTSDDNSSYKRKDVNFAVAEGTDTCPRDVVELNGDTISSKGDQVGVLDLTGFELTDPFIAVTTDFDDGDGTFQNTAKEMLRVFASDDTQLPIAVASHKAVWRPQRDFRTGDLAYDGGVGDTLIALDVSNQRTDFPGWQGTGSDTRDGVVAFARGRNKYLSGAMCPSYPEVQDFWMGWVGECIAAGVDGMDVRISCHSSWTEWPESFGFNAPVVAEYQRRYGINPDVEDFDHQLLGDIRGDFFDQFLRKAKHRLAAAGKPLQLHLEVESFRPDAPQGRWRTRPGNINFHWRRWLRSGLADEATMFGRGWTVEQILDDPLANEMISEANANSVPMHLSKQVSRDGKQQADWVEKAYKKGGLAGYSYYESAGFLDGEKDGKLQFQEEVIAAIRERVNSLGLSD